MTYEEFNNVVEEQYKICKAVLDKKSKEYAPKADRLSAFKTASCILHKTPLQALSGQMSKHSVSLFEMIDLDHDYNDMALWQEKLTDSINYLFLMKALLLDEQASEAQKQAQNAF